jgi:diguanylate cyclase (GGDEF)-like protein/PAS domain S-box-containing protein
MNEAVRERLLAFVERTADFVGVCDGEGRVLYLNEAARKRLGVGDSRGLTTADLFPPEAFARYYDEVRPELLRSGAWNGTMPVLTASGESVPMLMSAVGRVSAGGEVTGLVTHARDLPVTNTADRGVEHARGQLRGLFHVSAHGDRAGSTHAVLDEQDQRVALARAAVDGMSDVTRTFGTDIGANVLRVLDYRISQAVRATDTVVRIGDDEFAVLFWPVRDAGEALRLAEGVRDAMEQMPIVTAAGDISVGVALGVAVGTRSDRTEELLGRAAALRVADRGSQRAGRQTLEGDGGARLNELRIAVSHGDVQAFVQPVVDLRTGRVVGYEGLARWHRDDAGAIEAEAFMSAAGTTPLAPVVDLRVARETAAVVTVMSRTADLRVYAQVSEPLLEDVRIEQYLWEIVDAYGLAPDRLHIQLEQGIVTRLAPATQMVLQSLLELGVKLVVTGVDSESDLGAFAHLGFREVRLSPEATARAISDLSRLEALRRMILGAHDFGLAVGVVGVDDEQQRAIWFGAGCDVATGAIFGSPVRSDTVE